MHGICRRFAFSFARIFDCMQRKKVTLLVLFLHDNKMNSVRSRWKISFALTLPHDFLLILHNAIVLYLAFFFFTQRSLRYILSTDILKYFAGDRNGSIVRDFHFGTREYFLNACDITRIQQIQNDWTNDSRPEPNSFLV